MFIMSIRIIFLITVLTILHVSSHYESETNQSTHYPTDKPMKSRKNMETSEVLVPSPASIFTQQSTKGNQTEKEALQEELSEAATPGKSDTDIEKGETNTMEGIKSLELPNLLARFCPKDNVCADNSLHNVSDREHSSCCTDCSCSDNCQSTMNCCFPSTELESDDTIQSTVCYSSLYPPKEENEIEGYKSYQMIVAVNNHNNGTSGDKCGNVNVAPWGSLYPVYSKSKRKIYKNQVCAAADGVGDAVAFKASVSCLTSRLIFRSAVFTNSMWKNFNEGCNVWFVFPGDEKEEFGLLCYRKIVETCPDKFANSLLMPRDQLIAACNSGLVSHFIGGRKAIYKNVFCSICNDDFQQKCHYVDFYERTRRSYTALLEGMQFESFGGDVSPNIVQQACQFINGEKVEDSCRPVVCPIGMMLNLDGVCKPVLMTWYNYEVLVYLQLKSDVLFEVTGLDKSSFESQWSRHWTIEKIYYFPTNHSQPSVTDSIIVLVYRKFNSVNPKYIHDLIRRHKNTKWTVKTTNDTLSLTADFMNEEDQDIYNIASNRTRLLQYIYFIHIRYDNAIAINQMSYCDQVRLHAGEFDIHETYRVGGSRNFVIYNRFTGTLLVHGEYYYPDVYDNTQIIVCIEKSGLRRVGNLGQTIKVETIVLAFFLLSTLEFIW